MQESHIVNLCHILTHIVFYFNTILQSRFNGKHITGILNVEAEVLSCSQDHPTSEQIFQFYPDMASLPAYLVPPMIISAINYCLSRTLKKATLSNVTVTLTSSECNYFKLGAKNWASKTLI